MIPSSEDEHLAQHTFSTIQSRKTSPLNSQFFYLAENMVNHKKMVHPPCRL